MRVSIHDPDRDFFGTFFRGFLGAPSTNLQNYFMRIFPEMEYNLEDTSITYFFSSPNHKPFGPSEVLVEIKNELTFLPTKRILGFNYRKKPFHLMDVLVFSPHKVVHDSALSQLLITRQQVQLKSKKPFSPLEEEIEKEKMRNRLESFCSEYCSPTTLSVSRSQEPPAFHRKQLSH